MENSDADRSASPTKAAGLHKKSKKAQLNPISGQCGTVSNPQLLFRKNIELAVALKRVKRKLAKSKDELADFKQREEVTSAIVSSVNRAMDCFLRGCSAVIPDSEPASTESSSKPPNHLPVAADRNSAWGKFIKDLYGRESRKSLLKNVAKCLDALPDTAGDETQNGKGDTEMEEDMEKDSESNEAFLNALPDLVDKETTRQVDLMLAALRKVYESMTKAELRSSGTLGLNSDQRKVLEELERLKEIESVYKDRISFLEGQVSGYRSEAERLAEGKDSAIRRLALVCNEVLNQSDTLALAEKIGEGDQGKEESKGGIDKTSADDSKAAAEKDNTELVELHDVAANRLEEIGTLVKEKQGLIEEVESLKAELYSKSTVSIEKQSESHCDNGSSDEKFARLQAEMHLVQEEKLAFQKLLQDAEKAWECAKEKYAETIKKLENKHASSCKEKDKFIAYLRQKIKKVSADQVQSEHQSEVDYAAQYSVLLKAMEQRVNQLEKALEDERGSPALRILQEKLDCALKETLPVSDAENVLKNASLEAELASLREFKDSNTAVRDELEGLINETTERNAILTQQNSSLLSSLEEKENDAKRWCQKYLSVNEKLTQVNHQLSLKEKEHEEEIRQRSEYGESQNLLQERLEALERESSLAQEHFSGLEEFIAKERNTHQSTLSDFNSAKKVNEGLLKSIADIKVRNVQCLQEKEEAIQARNRSEEERKKLQRRLERLKSETLFNASQPEIDLRLREMDNALRCPLRSEYWKDAIIIKCSHMFSRRALEENLAKRNRKCPTCKHLFNKEDIRDIFLYQSNDD